MPEKEFSPLSAPDEPAAGNPADQPEGAPPAEAGGPEPATATFSRKVKSLVGDFVDYAKKADL